jgi:ABC-type transporter Mla MlaB component
MIRIETIEERLDLMTLVLSGHIQADDLPELKRVMEGYAKPVLLNLTGVKLVDPDAVRFLADFEAHNGRITNCPSYIREWIRRERGER